jgi:hypothetical protein
MQKQLTDYDVKDLIKLAVGAGAYSSSPVWGGKGQSPATNPHAVTSNPTGGFGTELGKSLAPAGKAIWNNGGKETFNTGMNTLQGLGTTATGLANTAAGGIGSLAAGVNQGAARFQDAVGLTRDATSMADAFAKPMNQAFVAGLKDTAGGAADTLSGGYYNYDGTPFAGAQPTAPHPGTAVEQMRSGMRDQLGRGTTADMAFRGTNAVSDFAAETAAFGGLGRGINVGAKAVQGSRAAPVLNAAAQTPVVGRPMAAAGNFLAGAAPEANMFAKTPMQYARATGGMGLADEAANLQNHLVNAVDPIEQPALTGPEATQPNPQGGPSTAQKPPAPAPAPAQAQPAPAQPAGPVGTADKSFAAVMPQLSDEKTPLPQRQELAKSTVRQHMDQNPELKQGLQDHQAGNKNTPAAQAFQAEQDKYKNTMIYDEFDKLKQANPTANLSDPGTYASFLSQASNTAMSKFNEMPMEHKMLTGLGLGGGLIGILSSLFGGGGMGGGLLGLLGLAAGGMAGAAGGMFGNQARAQTGQLMNDAASFFGGVNVPTADKLAPGAEQQTVQQIQNAMNQTGEKGQRGGWAAGQKIIDEQRSQADTLLKMPRTLAITSLMGLRGEGAPKTEAEATTLLDSIAQRHATASQPGFLRQRAHEQARATLRAQDKDGWLPAMLKNRGPDGDGMNWMREGGVHSKLNTPEHKMFLNPDGTLPAGTTEDEFIANMLRNAYGEYPEPAPAPEKVSSMNIAQEIYFKQAAQKAARCWAGYEPVPGKAPYSDNSCRPKRKAKKTKSKESAK